MHINCDYSGNKVAFTFNCTVCSKKKKHFLNPVLPRNSLKNQQPHNLYETYTNTTVIKVKDKTITKYSSRLATVHVNDQNKKIFMRLSLNLRHPKELLCDFFFYLDFICMTINIVIWNLVSTCMNKTSEYTRFSLLGQNGQTGVSC